MNGTIIDLVIAQQRGDQFEVGRMPKRVGPDGAGPDTSARSLPRPGFFVGSATRAGPVRPCRLCSGTWARWSN